MSQSYNLKNLFTKILEELKAKKDLIDFGGSLIGIIDWATKFGKVSTAWSTGNTGHISTQSTYLATPLYRNCKAVTLSELVRPLYTWEEVTLERSTGNPVITGKYYTYTGGVNTWSDQSETKSGNGIYRQVAVIDLSSLMLDSTTESAICYISIRNSHIIGCSARLYDSGKLYLNLQTQTTTKITSSTTVNFWVYEPAITQIEVK